MPKTKPSISFQAVRAGTLLYARAELMGLGAMERMRRLATGFLGEALSAEERSRLSQALYDQAGPGSGTALELFPWEARWFGEELPDPPARLLVGGAGAGREVAALTAQGYAVDALEPAAAMAASCRRRAGADAQVVTASYEDLAAAVLDGEDNPARALADQRYDAVILGWGSLTHVLAPGQRTRLMRTVDALCPSGPILASYWARWERRADRYERFGRRVGGWLAGMRGVHGGRGDGEVFHSKTGFGVEYDDAEIQRLAGAVGRQAVNGADGGFPHTTFRKLG